MSIDIHSESLVSFEQASEVTPGRPHKSTLHRWRLRGIRGIRLETCLIGGRRFTSREALQRFAERTSAVATSGPAPSPIERKSEQAFEAAEQILDAAGI